MQNLITHIKSAFFSKRHVIIVHAVGVLVLETSLGLSCNWRLHSTSRRRSLRCSYCFVREYEHQLATPPI
ncbi:hypothetical protein Leryth_004305 [Lithospermum erythrorhizon]|nr:hypothetical protein Leryth_004305 [Lithospermum erythrorhizon]